MGLRDAIRALYDEREHSIEPYVGDAFEFPTSIDLRILSIGINAYVSEDELQCGTKPEKWREWWTEESYRFFKTAREATRKLGQALRASSFFRGLTFRDPSCGYATNFIKSYLPEAMGKEATSVPPSMFEADFSLWQREIDLLARHGALPHVVVAFGDVIWRHLWPSFLQKDGVAFEHLRPCSEREFVWLPDGKPSKHRVSRYVVGTASGEQPLLLLRLDHPSRGATYGSLDSLLAAPDFRQVAGLPED